MTRAERILREIQGDRHEMRILAAMTRGEFKALERIGVAAVEEFLRKYPEPEDFEVDALAFLEDVRERQSAEQYEVYRGDMARFRRAVYGKRQEEYEEQKAVKTGVKGARTMEMAELEEQIGQARKKEVAIREMSEQEAAEMLRKAQIEGDPWLQNGTLYRLTTEILEMNGLAPKYKLGEIGVSRIFKAGDKEAVMAYVGAEDKIAVRAFYREEEVWRMLTGYVSDGRGRTLRYEAEELSEEVQEGLDLVKKRQRKAGITEVMAEFLMAGTARGYEKI